jgi:hypothetical protein
MNEFDIILEECVDLIASGDTTLEECLIQYPEYAAELEPVLSTLVCLQEGRELTPPPFLRARIRTELHQAMKEKPPQKNRLPVFFWRMALNVGVMMFAFVMTNTVFAQGALPGESLYNWKLASETLWRSVAVDPLAADLKLSDRRINEYVAVQDEQRRAQVLIGYNKLLVRFRDEPNDVDQARIQNVLKSQQDSLRRAGLSIPALDSYVSGGALNISEQSQAPDRLFTRPAP